MDYSRIIGGNWPHLKVRGIERISVADKRVMDKVLTSISRRIKQRRMPNYAWYKTVHNNGKHIGYICGQGSYISTILLGRMSPYGKPL
jgi:hypothetical protein